MASDTQPPAFKIALAGWRDALRAITQMMSVAGPAFLFSVMAEAADQLLRSYSPAIEAVIFPIQWIAQSLVLTPLAISVHRYVLLDETTPHYALNLADQRFRRFFGVAVAIQLLWLSVGIWLVLGHFAFDMPLSGEPISPKARDNLFWMFVIVFGLLVSFFVVARVILSIVIVFPAVAIDAPGAGWRNARADSKEHIFRIFCAFALGLVPILLIDEIDDLIQQVGSHPTFDAIAVVLRAAKSVLIASAFAAIASTFYLAYGRRLSGDAPVA